MSNVLAFMSPIDNYMQQMRDLDQVDHQILHSLHHNARQSNVELAEKIGLSPSACLRRVQELERNKVLTGYHASVDPQAVGKGFLAYITVGLSNHRKQVQERFEKTMSAAHQVIECHNITGAYEYLLRVQVRDLTAYKKFHTDVLGALDDVATITSYIVMGSSKDRPD